MRPTKPKQSLQVHLMGYGNGIFAVHETPSRRGQENAITNVRSVKLSFL
jgi:hypothetical protein